MFSFICLLFGFVSEIFGAIHVTRASLLEFSDSLSFRPRAPHLKKALGVNTFIVYGLQGVGGLIKVAP